MLQSDGREQCPLAASEGAEAADDNTDVSTHESVKLTVRNDVYLCYIETIEAAQVSDDILRKCRQK